MGCGQDFPWGNTAAAVVTPSLGVPPGRPPMGVCPQLCEADVGGCAPPIRPWGRQAEGALWRRMPAYSWLAREKASPEPLREGEGALRGPRWCG